MIIYLPNDPLPGGKYGLSYQALREDYLRFTMMSDKEFVENAATILHFACVVCYLKEAPSQVVLSDTGIIHELVHLVVDITGPITPLSQIREQFDIWCCLAA